MNRRSFLGTAAAALATSPVILRAQSEMSLLNQARGIAARPYRPNTTPLPAPFAGLSYDAYRGIRPLPGRAALLRHGEAFAVDLLPPGLFFPDPMRIDLMTPTGPRDLTFSPSLFDFDARYFDTIPESAPGAGFSGLRLRHPLNTPDRMDEVMVVQGASYFRAIGQDMVYGLSARSVALGTGGAGPEEFPRFTHLRLYPPHDDTVRLEGIIDSPSLAAHLDLTLRPGADTMMDIRATILPRVDIADIGIAPLTSMYLKGPLRSAVSDDFRPRVHDSDVLMVENGAGEALWRPISNPAQIETSAFADTHPKSFGLYQTARDFDAFQDTEARYHDRPSARVVPQGDWGSGAVMLVEIPTGDEFMDNIVAFWRPADPLAAQSEHAFAYHLLWTFASPDTGRPMTVLQTRSGQEHDRPGTRRYVIDFTGTAPALTPDLTAQDPSAKITGISLFPRPDGTTTRVTFLLTPGETDAVDLRLVLRDGTGQAASPVWLHRWTRKRNGQV